MLQYHLGTEPNLNFPSVGLGHTGVRLVPGSFQVCYSQQHLDSHAYTGAEFGLDHC